MKEVQAINFIKGLWTMRERNLFRTIKQFTSKGGSEGYFAEKHDRFAKAALINEYK